MLNIARTQKQLEILTDADTDTDTETCSLARTHTHTRTYTHIHTHTHTHTHSKKKMKNALEQDESLHLEHVRANTFEVHVKVVTHLCAAFAPPARALTQTHMHTHRTQPETEEEMGRIQIFHADSDTDCQEWVKQLQQAIANALLVHRREQTSLLGRIQMRMKRVYDGDLIQFVVVGIIIANFMANVVEYELMSTEPDTVQRFNDLDLSFTIIFTVELVANMIAHADMLPLPFLGDGWNILDIIVVAVSLVTAGNLLGGQSSSIKTIRILRAFRVVSIHPQPPSVPVAALAAMCLHACIVCVCVCVCVCVYIHALTSV